MTETLAQTNLQLYLQLRASGASPQEVQALQKDYETACLLFGALSRSTGRPFLCHAVGTASAALHEGATILDVRAALLHAAYKHGRFPDGKKKRTPNHEVWLTNRVGNELAALLGKFSKFSFAPDDVRGYIETDTPPDDLALRLIRLKLANDVDDSHDFGAALGHKPRYENSAWLELRLALAQKLGFSFCANSFARSLEQLEDSGWLDTQTVFARQGHIRSIPGQILSGLRGKGYC